LKIQRRFWALACHVFPWLVLQKWLEIRKNNRLTLLEAQQLFIAAKKSYIRLPFPAVPVYNESRFERFVLRKKPRQLGGGNKIWDFGTNRAGKPPLWS
jgi:hypothetical protein